MRSCLKRLFIRFRSWSASGAVPAVTVVVAVALFLLLSIAPAAAESRWYKGATHAHSLWSDGDEFPEMVVDWFKSHGYDFFCLSDHNVLMEGEKWTPLRGEKRQIPDAVVEKCRRRFGEDWVELRGEGAAREVRLRTFEELKRQFDEPGRFLLLQGEEITGKCGEKQVHVNAINLTKRIMPERGQTVVETIQAALAAVRRQARETNRTILAHVNHPNWKDYDISADDLARAVDARLFELCNNQEDINHNGDATHPSTERLWDIANTIRLVELGAPVLFGVGSDDSHRYHQMDPRQANPGRAWIMVRAERLAVDPILEAIERGDFYVSTGVVLARLDFDREQGILHVAVEPKPGTRYTIEFIGTTTGADPAAHDSPAIGKVLARHEGTQASYRLGGNELFVRAAIRSDRKMENPPANSVDLETAWTQPYGWQKRLGAK